MAYAKRILWIVKRRRRLIINLIRNSRVATVKLAILRLTF